MKSESKGATDLEHMISRAAIEAAKFSSQASESAKRIIDEIKREVSDTKGYDLPAIDLIDTNEELIAMLTLPGASKDKIDLRITEDSISVEAKVASREGTYLRRERSPSGFKRAIKLPVEIKPEQAKASFDNGILEVHLPKLIVINAQKVKVD